MADPSYVDADGVLTDPEAWVAIGPSSPAGNPLGSDAAYVTFTNPSDGSSLDWSQYMDLVVVAYCRGTKSSTMVQYHITLNGNASTDYGFQRLQSDGSNANAYSEMSNNRAELHHVPAASANNSGSGNIFGTVITHFFDINSGKYKTAVSQVANDQNGAGSVALFANTWRNPAPLTTIKIWPDTNNWKAGSRFDLFGVLPRMVS